MNYGFISTDTLERTARFKAEQFQTPIFTFTFASPSSSPLKRAVSEPAQKESDQLVSSKVKQISNESMQLASHCLSPPPFSQSKYFDVSSAESMVKNPRHYSSLEGGKQYGATTYHHQPNMHHHQQPHQQPKASAMMNGHSKSTSSQINIGNMTNNTVRPKCPSDNVLKKLTKTKPTGYPTKAESGFPPTRQIRIEYRHCRSLTTSLSNVKSVLVPVLNSLEKLTSCSKQKAPRRIRKADTIAAKSKEINKSVETLVTQSELEIDAGKSESVQASRKDGKGFWKENKVASSSSTSLALETFSEPNESYVNNGMITSDLSIQSSDTGGSKTIPEVSASDQNSPTSPEEERSEKATSDKKDFNARKRRRGYYLTKHVAGHCFTSLLVSPTEEPEIQLESVQAKTSQKSPVVALTPPLTPRPPCPQKPVTIFLPSTVADATTTANAETCTSTAFSQYFFKPIHTAPVSSESPSKNCFPFSFPGGKKRHHKSTENTSSSTSDDKRPGCFGSHISQRFFSAVKVGDKRSHSGRRKHLSAGTIKPKATYFPFSDGTSRPFQPYQYHQYPPPSSSASKYSFVGGSGYGQSRASTTATTMNNPGMAPTLESTAARQRFRFRFSSGGHTAAMKRNRHGTIVEGQQMEGSATIGGSNQSNNARSSSIDNKPQETLFGRIYPAPQYFSVDCIDAVEISSTGRFVSRLAERRSRFRDSHDRRLHRTATLANKTAEKSTAAAAAATASRASSINEKKKWKTPEPGSHQQLTGSCSSHVNYNTFSSSGGMASGAGFAFVRNPSINIAINSSSSRSKTPTPTSVGDDTAIVGGSSKKESLTSPTAAATASTTTPVNSGDAANNTGSNNSHNGSSFLKEQIWAFLKPTDNKLAMKLFGNKKLASKERAKRAKQNQQRSWIIHPRSTLRLYWDLLMFSLLLTNIIILPLAISFFTENILLGFRWISLNCLCDVVFLTDILLNFRTGIILDSYSDTVIVAPGQIAHHYLRTWFVLDFISSLPFDVIIVFFTPHSNAPHIAYAGRALRIFRLVKFVSLLRLLRLSRVGRYLTQLRVDYGQFVQMASRLMQILSLVFIILLLGHWNGCLQWFVPMLQHYPGDSWTALENLKDSEWTEQYTWAVFKALSHMLSIGFGRYPPQSTTDVWLTIISMLTGATCYALFVGQSTTIIQSFGISKRLYQEKFQQIDEYMSYRKLPRPLRRNITKYYEHRYRGKMFDETSILAEVNECLHEEIVNFNCRSLISSVSFFEKADQNFVSDLVSKLQSEVYLPGNVIVREGTVGNKMYFLQEGTVSILNKAGKCVAKLSEGSYFGEVCLLANTKRVASVKADNYCNVFTLAVDHFVSVLERYPNMRQVMESVAKQRVDNCFHEDEERPAGTGDEKADEGEDEPDSKFNSGDKVVGGESVGGFEPMIPPVIVIGSDENDYS